MASRLHAMRPSAPSDTAQRVNANAPQPQAGRLEAIDFVRGIAILEMTAAHFSGAFPVVIAKVVNYSETAMALFILLAGFMVGWHYYPRFVRDQRTGTLRLLKRALQIVLIQYIIIATVSLPLRALNVLDVGRDEPLLLFLLKSVTFQNQVGIIHVLPTFVPLFLVAPLLLWGFKHGLGPWVLAASACVFAFGNVHPYVFDYDQPTVFPFVVVQIYFVAGCFWGKSSQANQKVWPERLTFWWVVSLCMLIVTMTALHGKFFPGGLVSTHPLNVFGLVYHVPLILFVLFSTARFWGWLRGSSLQKWTALLGRHAMLAFVLHLYFAKVIGVLSAKALVSRAGVLLLMASSVVLSCLAVWAFQRADRSHPSLAIRALDGLFK